MQEMRTPTDCPVLEPNSILIVDDEAPIVAALEYLVEDLGFTPISAKNGREAVALIRQRWPILILTDFMMPLVSGVQVIQEMRALAATWDLISPIVIIMTAVEPNTIAREIADEMVRKPFEIPDMEQLIKRLLMKPSAE